ncbi:MAG: 3-deoxy-7-phosphoheptulonate synthase [Ardenticatenaceae bacterium]|nr:3-deoxy-7-phosphoheptulonate synthase [Ardenticatenaceae bacterium]
MEKPRHPRLEKMQLPSDIFNTNVLSETVLISPERLHHALPSSPKVDDCVRESRRTIQNILDRRDHRLLVIVGPCSIHDPQAAMEYAVRLKQLSDDVSDTLYVAMRIYFEKPRTTVGWKGFINDPDLDDSGNIEKGLTEARKLLLWLGEMGLPAATEALDPISPQYLADLFAWVAIGARTTESQTHREMASGLSMPVGFKNGTRGDLDVAVNAMRSALSPHKFIGINLEGQATIMHTRGNKYGHVILRGGRQPNYDSVNVRLCEEVLEKADLPVNLVVDCSHANSYKKHELQPLVADNIASQIINGNQSIVGMMLESHLNEGNQKFPGPEAIQDLQYGVSVTDACISWETTDILLRNLREKLKRPLVERQGSS